MKLRIFIASPSDVGGERDILSTVVVPELRRTLADATVTRNDSAVDLEAVRWETHAVPAIGEDAQDAINQEIGDFDILVGIMWRRFGSPTLRADSGTGEEFQRAYELFRKYQRPEIMFYFRTTPFYPESNRELTQFRKVLNFKKKLVQLGVLFWEYGETIDFERYVREHLARKILRIGRSASPESAEPSSEFTSAKATKSHGYKPRVFLSYAAEDQEAVRKIAAMLRGAGFDPWFDRDILLPGQAWLTEVRKAIRESDFFLTLVSESSVGKKHGFLHKEIRWALDKVRELPLTDVYVFVVRLDRAEPPAELGDFTWLDLQAEGGVSQLASTMWATWRERH